MATPMNNNILQFPHRAAGTITVGNTLRAPFVSSHLPTPAAENYRGIHLVNYTAIAPHLENTQARANRIVAQVEREVALQAAKSRVEHIMRTHRTLPTPHPLPAVTSIETPASVARRLIHALLAFAMPA